MTLHGLRLAVSHAFHDWKRDMSPRARAILWIGILIQGYAIYAAITRSLVWPLSGRRFLYCWRASAFLRHRRRLLQRRAGVGVPAKDAHGGRRDCRTLDSTQSAARDAGGSSGLQIAASYEPFRIVGGDYFDIVRLSSGRTLLAVADVSGKGMAAALLSANLQALVRTLARWTTICASLPRE